MNTYDVGDAIRITGTFRSAAGTLTNPTTVTIDLTAPDGTVTHPSATSGSTGVYTATVTPDQHGVWTYRFIGTGAVAEQGERSFTVRRPR